MSFVIDDVPYEDSEFFEYRYDIDKVLDDLQNSVYPSIKFYEDDDYVLAGYLVNTYPEEIEDAFYRLFVELLDSNDLQYHKFVYLVKFLSIFINSGFEYNKELLINKLKYKISEEQLDLISDVINIVGSLNDQQLYKIYNGNIFLNYEDVYIFINSISNFDIIYGNWIINNSINEYIVRYFVDVFSQDALSYLLGKDEYLPDQYLNMNINNLKRFYNLDNKYTITNKFYELINNIDIDYQIKLYLEYIVPMFLENIENPNSLSIFDQDLRPKFFSS